MLGFGDRHAEFKGQSHDHCFEVQGVFVQK